MANILKSFLQESASIKQELLSNEAFLSLWQGAANHLETVVQGGGTIYICGNGGSACDAMHFREELAARYKREREGIRAQHFIDGSTLTCWGNDYDFSSVFKRDVETFLTEKDCLVAISTSGNSKNIIEAVNAAKLKGSKVIGLLGKDGGAAKKLVDFALIVPSEETDRIQEVHITLIHAFCEYLERNL